MTDGCLVLLLIQVTVTFSHINMHTHTHTHYTWQLKLSHWCIISSHAHCVRVAHAATHTNAECFVSQGCSQAVKRVHILDTLLQLASLHMQHTPSRSFPFLPLSLSPSRSFSVHHEISVHIGQMQQANLALKPHIEQADIQAEAARHTGTQAKTLSISIILIPCSKRDLSHHTHSKNIILKAKSCALCSVARSRLWWQNFLYGIKGAVPQTLWLIHVQQ